jgi:hypothetical protein
MDKKVAFSLVLVVHEMEGGRPPYNEIKLGP